MNEVHEHTMPDYFPRFACKMGACRTSCCEGWRVSVSMTDYFRLLGVDCSPELRSRLDVGFAPADSPSTECYAHIRHGYDGNCRLRLPDGRCSVHAEVGEGYLPAVCRLYPRAVREEGDRECSCAGSCEAVIELLLHHPEPLTFIRREYPDEAMPKAHTVYNEVIPFEQELRLQFIGILQDRTASLPRRIMRLGLRAYQISPALSRNDPAEIRSALETPLPVLPELDESVQPAHLAKGLAAIEKVAELLDAQSESLREYGDAALAYFGRSFERYTQARALYDSRFPNHDSFIENLLVNHMFFSRFPFADGGEPLYDECLALAVIYALLRFLHLGWTAEHPREEDLADVTAAAFRLIDHTAFHHSAARILKDVGTVEPGDVYDLLTL